jgi:uncharacterized membrane protein YeaQ/YmgE (transglycosylase-associated protein family)
MNSVSEVILWIVVAASIGWLATWIGTRSMGLESRAGGFGNVIIGAVGAIVGVLLVRSFLGDRVSNSAFIRGVGVALVIGCVLLFLWMGALRNKEKA